MNQKQKHNEIVGTWIEECLGMVRFELKEAKAELRRDRPHNALRCLASAFSYLRSARAHIKKLK